MFNFLFFRHFAFFAVFLYDVDISVLFVKLIDLSCSFTCIVFQNSREPICNYLAQ